MSHQPPAALPGGAYAVIFTSLRRTEPNDGYGDMSARMTELARAQPGFLGVESARNAEGVGITVSYWATMDDVRTWSRHAEHLVAQRFGRDNWYEWFAVRICRVEHSRSFTRPEEPT